MNLPDVGAGTPFSLIWWLAVTVLFVLGVGGPVMAYRLNRAMDRREKNEEHQNEVIQGMFRELHICQIQCAEHRGRSVQREEFEGRLIRFEELIVRVHKRIDEIAVKLGVRPEIRS